jgi:hypothetical protein
MASAFANRQELAQNNVQQEINKIDTSYFSNQSKPAVDLIAIVRPTCSPVWHVQSAGRGTRHCTPAGLSGYVPGQRLTAATCR